MNIIQYPTILAAMWFFAHLLIIPLFLKVNKKKKWEKVIVGLTMLIVFASAYALKPYTYDLTKYSAFFHSGFIPEHSFTFKESSSTNKVVDLDSQDMTGIPYELSLRLDKTYEPGFVALNKWLKMVIPSGSIFPRYIQPGGSNGRADGFLLSILFISLTINLLTISLWGKQTILGATTRFQEYIYILPIMLGTPYILIGTQNSIRQHLGLSLVLLSFVLFKKSKYLVSAILLCIAILFHKWAVLFGVGFLFVDWSSGFICKKCESQKLELIWSAVLSFVVGVGLVLLVWVMSNTGLGGLLDWTLGLSEYLSRNEVNDHQERPSVLIKLVALGLVLMGSELIAGKSTIGDNWNIRALRRAAYFLILPFVVYPEIFSRLFYLCFALEMIFLVKILDAADIRMRLAGIFVFLLYGIAPNCVNVLIGAATLSSIVGA